MHAKVSELQFNLIILFVIIVIILLFSLASSLEIQPLVSYIAAVVQPISSDGHMHSTSFADNLFVSATGCWGQQNFFAIHSKMTQVIITLTVINHCRKRMVSTDMYTGFGITVIHPSHGINDFAHQWLSIMRLIDMVACVYNPSISASEVLALLWLSDPAWGQ